MQTGRWHVSAESSARRASPGILHQLAAFIAHHTKNQAVHCNPIDTTTMARYYSDVDHCAEERSRPYANPGFCHGEGGERYAVRKEAYEEVDEVGRAGRGHHGHLANSGSHLGHSGHLAHSGGHEGHLGHREQHGHGGRRYDACGSTYDSCTGQY